MAELDQAVNDNDPQPQAGAEEFDAERAKALIAKLRPYEKQARQLEKELASLRQADEERKLAEMTQVERLQAELVRATEARQKLEADYQRQLRTNAVIAAAAKAGMHDPGDAVALLADVDADALDQALEGLKKGKPYLFKTSTAAAFSPTNPQGGAARPSDQEILADIYGSRRSNIFAGGGVFSAGQPE